MWPRRHIWPQYSVTAVELLLTFKWKFDGNAFIICAYNIYSGRVIINVQANHPVKTKINLVRFHHWKTFPLMNDLCLTHFSCAKPKFEWWWKWTPCAICQDWSWLSDNTIRYPLESLLTQNENKSKWTWFDFILKN